MDQPRTEDDLRAAFALAAQDAPAAVDVLAKVRAAAGPPADRAPRREQIRRWAPVAVVAAVIVAVAIPVAISLGEDRNRGAASAGSTYDVGSTAAGAANGAVAPAAGSTAGGASSAASGPGIAGPLTPTASRASAGRTCTPADLTMVISWTNGASGLTGVLKVANHTSAACDLAVKPAIYPLDAAGQRLAVQNVASAEGYAGPQRLLAGASATSTLTWMSWCGTKAAPKAEVDWGNGVGTVDVAPGPTEPDCLSAVPADISSEWFTPLS